MLPARLSSGIAGREVKDLWTEISSVKHDVASLSEAASYSTLPSSCKTYSMAQPF